MSIGNNIKQLRLKHGLDQVQLGVIAGVTDKAVSSWENDISVPRMGAIEKMAAYFGVRKSDIIEDKSETHSTSNIISYNGTDPLKQEISTMVTQILNKTDDATQLKLLRNLLEGFLKD